MSLLDPVADAVAAIAAGRPVVVVDDEDRENEGDIIFAAEFATCLALLQCAIFALLLHRITLCAQFLTNVLHTCFMFVF